MMLMMMISHNLICCLEPQKNIRRNQHVNIIINHIYLKKIYIKEYMLKN